MPVRDPYIAQGFQNLAELMKPPSGSDLYGYAKAGEQSMKNQSLAQYYKLAQDPSTPKEMLDQAAINAGMYDYRGSKYTVDADNSTKIKMNAADNATAIAETRIKGDYELQKPVTVKEGETVILGDRQRQLSPSLADSYFGGAKLNQGQDFVKPDGTRVAGPEKPLSETEWKAKQADDMYKSGAMEPNELKALIMGNTPVEETYGADGNPVYGYRTDLVGKPSVQKNTSMTIGPDGKPVITSSTATGGKYTEFDHKVSLNADQIVQGVAEMNKLDREGYEPSLTSTIAQSLISSPAGMAVAINSGVLPPQDQRAFASLKSLLNFQFLVSGAAVPEQEVARRALELMPIAGEDATLREYKRNQRNQIAEFYATHSKDQRVREMMTAAQRGEYTPPANGNMNASSSVAQPSQAHIAALKANPQAAAEFDAKFGQGAAAKILGGQ